jgi:adenylate cyclase
MPCTSAYRRHGWRTGNYRLTRSGYAPGVTTGYTLQEAAERAGVDSAYVTRLQELGIFPSGLDAFSEGDVRRVLLARSLEGAGIPLDAVGDAVQRGAVRMDFLDASAYDRFAALCDETFAQVSERTGVPFELLSAMRESIGMPVPTAEDRLREDELGVLPSIQRQVELGFRHASIERLLRVYGDATRRITEQEAAWWQSEVIEPTIASGRGAEDVGNPELSNELSPLTEQAVVAMYHAQQARAWTANIIENFEQLLANAGIHSRLQQPPAICFLDISGYTRLTQEMGDDAAAELAATVARLVQRSSVQHGGKTIKWLGDGVMFYFADPAPGVRSALEMAAALPAAGLPQVHVGLHAGPVLFQEGDYFGATVNLSARIADYARPGEVLVSQAVVDASNEEGIAFVDVGPVELKGVSGTVHLLRAHRT